MSSIPPEHSRIGEESNAPALAKIEALRAKEDTAYAKLQASLQTQIDATTAEITQLEARLVVATGKSKTQIKSRLESLQVKRDAAYEKLHASLQAQIDSITIELKALEEKAETGTSDFKAQLAARLEALKATRDASKHYRQTTGQQHSVQPEHIQEMPRP